MFSDQYISRMWVLHPKELQDHCCQPQQCWGYIQSGSSPSIRSFTRFCVGVINGLVLHAAVYKLHFVHENPCLRRLDLSIFVLDFAHLDPLVPLHSFSQLGPSPRTTKLQAVFIFQFKWEGSWLCSRRPCNLFVCHCLFEAFRCWPFNLPALAFSFLSEGLR